MEKGDHDGADEKAFVWRRRACSSKPGALVQWKNITSVLAQLASLSKLNFFLQTPYRVFVQALGSIVHLPIWPDEGQGDCFIKREGLRKRKQWIKGWILRITNAFELPWEDQKWAVVDALMPAQVICTVFLRRQWRKVWGGGTRLGDLC